MPPLLIRNSLGTPGTPTPVSGPPGSGGSLVIPGRLAPPTHAAPAPPSPPSTPATTDYTSKANDIVSSGLAAGTDWANKVLPDGTLTRISDPRAGEVNDYLAKLKERTGGMDSAEMLAAKEQNQQYSDQALAQNERRLSGIAGAAGVRGGAAAGLQATAIQQSQQSRDALQRQLVLDNIDQQNKAFASYGGALTGQQGTELGIQTYNGGQSDKEKLGRPALATQYYGMVDSAASGLRADDQTKAATTTAQNYLNSLKTPAAPAPTSGGSATGVAAVDGASGRVAAANGPANTGFTDDGNGGPNAHYNVEAGAKYLTAANAQGVIDHNSDAYIKQKYPNATTDTLLAAARTDPLVRQALFNASTGYKATPQQKQQYDTSVEGYDSDTANQFTGANNCCWITTAAANKGTLDANIYRDIVTFCPVTDEDRRAYNVWGRRLAELSKTSRFWGAFVDTLLTDTLNVLRGRPYGWRGTIGISVYRACNRLVRLFRGR